MKDESDIHQLSAEAARHVEYTPSAHPAIDHAQQKRVELRLKPFPRQRIPTPYGEQNENGTDLSLIRLQMKLSPTERVRQADAATASALWILRNARRID
jgi:hypothetical protein